MTITINQKPRNDRTLYPVKEIPTLEEFSWLTEAALRYHIYQSRTRLTSDGTLKEGNGMYEAGVIKRLGKRILIDVVKLRAWINNAGPSKAVTSSTVSKEIDLG